MRSGEPERGKVKQLSPDAVTDVHEMMRDIAGVRLQYFGPVRRGDRPDWSSNWRKRTRMPQLIRMDVSFNVNSGARWLPLIVQTHVEDDSGCIFDPATLDCLGR